MLKLIVFGFSIGALGAAIATTPRYIADCKSPEAQQAMQAFVQKNTFIALGRSKGDGPAKALGSYWFETHRHRTLSKFDTIRAEMDEQSSSQENGGKRMLPLVPSAIALEKVTFEGSMPIELRRGDEKGETRMCDVRFELNALMPSEFVNGNVPDTFDNLLQKISGRSRIRQTIEVSLKVEAPFNGWFGLSASSPQPEEKPFNPHESFSDRGRSLNIQ